MRHVIENLRKIAATCRDGNSLPPNLAEWLGGAIDGYLEHQCGSIEEALGLRSARGGVPWWLEEGMRVRNTALRELAARFFANGSVSAKAAHIKTLSQRYAASGYRFDRDRAEMPVHYCGTPHEWLWRAFKSGAAMPLGDRQLRKILG